MPTLSTTLRRAASNSRNLPLFVGCCVTSIAIEVFAAGGIFQMNTAAVPLLGAHIPLAPVEATISLMCGLLSIWASFAAAKAKADPRPEQQKRAYGARILSLFLLATPVYYAGNSFAYQRQLSDWQQFHGSPEEAAYTRQANDPQEDVMVRRDAIAALARSTRPLHAEFDFASTLWAAFLYGLNALAAGTCWIAKPETAAEAKRRVASERAKAAAKTRAANKKAAEKANKAKAQWVRNLREVASN